MPDGLTAFDAEIKVRTERTESLLTAAYDVVERTAKYEEGFKVLRTVNDVGFHINRAAIKGAYRSTQEYLDAIDAMNDFLLIEIRRLDPTHGEPTGTAVVIEIPRNREGQ